MGLRLSASYCWVGKYLGGPVKSTSHRLTPLSACLALLLVWFGGLVVIYRLQVVVVLLLFRLHLDFIRVVSMLCRAGIDDGSSATARPVQKNEFPPFFGLDCPLYFVEESRGLLNPKKTLGRPLRPALV